MVMGYQDFGMTRPGPLGQLSQVQLASNPLGQNNILLELLSNPAVLATLAQTFNNNLAMSPLAGGIQQLAQDAGPYPTEGRDPNAGINVPEGSNFQMQPPANDPFSELRALQLASDPLGQNRQFAQFAGDPFALGAAHGAGAFQSNSRVSGAFDNLFGQSFGETPSQDGRPNLLLDRAGARNMGSNALEATRGYGASRGYTPTDFNRAVHRNTLSGRDNTRQSTFRSY